MAARARGLKPGEKALDVTHYSVIKNLRAWVKNGAPPSGDLNTQELASDAHKDTPGAIYRLSGVLGLPGSHPRLDDVDMTEDKPLEPGYYLARHGVTDWSKQNSSAEGLSALRKTPHGMHILANAGQNLGMRV